MRSTAQRIHKPRLIAANAGRQFASSLREESPNKPSQRERKDSKREKTNAVQDLRTIQAQSGNRRYDKH
jgi:hypothetical protein